uniref:Peroxiredoxin-6 n=1 Tax=Xenopus tropicalis TaxID=8364 RepID=Q5M8E1_XENTR|nr:peroxiredoxin 6-like [Xenopus tropicalis]AAH88077.1 peroxiredoxin 6 [Xenopus tropicalis]
MSVLLGSVFPNFEAETTVGKIKFHDWLGDSWGILFSHPKDYTPVCTTELGRVVQLLDEFKKREIKLIAVSCDSVKDHEGWSEDILSYVGSTGTFPYPIIADPDRKLAKELGMIDPDEKDSTGMPLTARAVFIVGSDKRLKLSILYPATTGRNFDEILRVIDSLKLTARQKVATPVDWQPGKPCMVVPNLSNEEAKKLFPNYEQKTVPSGKNYLRFTPDY